MKIAIAEPVRPVEFSLWLDAFRWIAAWIVVVNHAGSILILPWSELPAAQRTILHLGFSFVAGFAHHAVMVFFVLSGFLVGGALCRDIARDRTNLWTYFGKRATRLWIVLLPALCLTFVCSRLGLWIYNPGGGGIFGTAKSGVFDVGTLICNSVYLQNVLCTTYGGNAALWSLFHEAWYYVVFPFIAIGVSAATVGRRFALVFPGVLILATLQFNQVANPPILPYFSIWLLGVGVAFVPLKDRRFQITAAAIAFIVALAFVRTVFLPTMEPGMSVKSFLLDVLVSGLFGWMLVAMRVAVDLKAVPFGKWNSTLAGFSFSLYCVHIPLLFLYASISMAVLGFGYQSPPVTYSRWILIFGGVGFAVLGGYLFSLVTERHTDVLRKALFGQANRAPATAVPHSRRLLNRDLRDL